MSRRDPHCASSSWRVHAEAGEGLEFREKRIYRRTVADQQGNPVSVEHMAFLKGAKVLTDTRLGPGREADRILFFPHPTGCSKPA